MRTLIIIVLSCMLVACVNTNRVKTQQPIVLDEISETIKFSEVKLVPLETNENILLGGDLTLKLRDNDMYIFDRSHQRCVLAFDTNGKFKTKIGRWGKGEGEYDNFNDFSLGKDEVDILAGKGESSMIYRYDYSGQFLGKKEISYAAFSLQNGNDSELIVGTGYNSACHANRLYILSKEGKELEKLLPNTTDLNIPVIENTLSEFDGDIYYHESFNDTVYTLEDHKLQPALIFDFGKYAIPSEFYSSDLMTGFELINKHGFANITKYYGNDDLALVEVRKQKMGADPLAHLVLVDRVDHHSSQLQYKPNDNSIFKNPMGLTDDNEIVFIIHPNMLQANADFFKQYGINVSEETYSLEDNPIVAFCKI
ncbi:6-bladed beta-propeller [Puteibacter caeruleilacunae]|nr:6-bladed beta-propeller [Puteibacter caeruleilacunae]